MDFLPWGPEEVPGFSCYHFNLPKLEAVDGGEGRACRGANENVTWSRRSGGGLRKEHKVTSKLRSNCLDELTPQKLKNLGEAELVLEYFG